VSSHIAICIPCYNEAANIKPLYKRLNAALESYSSDRFSIVFADNRSTDGTVAIIRELMQHDSRIGLIENVNNFGFVRSSANALLSPDADANIFLMSDLQDPPELIPELIQRWRRGRSQVVFAVRRSSRENALLFAFKKIYYALLSSLSDYPMVRNTTGFGIYDRSAILALRQCSDSYPYIKGLVCAIGFAWETVPYTSDDRRSGQSHASLGFLIDFGVLGIVTLSRKPMRIITYAGIGLGAFAIFLSSVVLVSKFLFWAMFQFGLAMLAVSGLFFLGVCLTALGIIGEYIGFLNQRSLKLPLVVEKYRINVPRLASPGGSDQGWPQRPSSPQSASDPESPSQS
jgi:glycosyltransferase involved in cell wall biosynthesis